MANTRPTLSVSAQLAYASGMLGWSVISNIISVMLIYFYLPPSGSGLLQLVPPVAFMGLFHIMSLLVASGRLFDAFTDPLIAYFSDRSKHPEGRRIPFMRWGLVPAVIFGTLLFFPISGRETMANAGWLFGIQLLFYFFITLYIIPYNALLPELAPSPEEKINLSTLLSLAFVSGMIVSSQTPALADILQDIWEIGSRQRAVQLAIASLSVLAGVCMAIPAWTLKEKKYGRHRPVSIAMIPALKQALRNRPFRFFLAADFSYFISISIITGGLLYYVKTLGKMPEAEGGKLMIVMVGLSLLLYPFIGKIANRTGKKRLILFSLAMLSFLFLGIYFTGKISFVPSVHLYLLFSLCSVPLTFLSIVPPALLAEIAETDFQETGQPKEGIYFAVRFLFIKLGQTLGMMSLAIFLLFGKDAGSDLGLRLTGVAGCILCLTGCLIFMKFEEKKH